MGEEEEAAQRLQQLLREGNESLHELHFESVSLENNFFLLAALQRHSALRTVRISDCDVGPEGAVYLAQVVRAMNLETLDLSSNGIGDVGAESVAQIRGLKRLILYDNLIGVVGIRALAQSLCIDGQLKELNLSSNRAGNDGVRSLAAALKCNQSLRLLDLESNEISSEGIQHLAEALRSNDTLIHLRLYQTHASVEDLAILGEALKGNASLETLDMDEHVPAVVSYLARNKLIVQQVRQIALLLIATRHCSKGEGMGYLGQVPKEIVLRLAKHVWATCGDREWLLRGKKLIY